MEPSKEATYPIRSFRAYIGAVLILAWLMACLDRQTIALLMPSLKRRRGGDGDFARLYASARRAKQGRSLPASPHSVDGSDPLSSVAKTEMSYDFKTRAA